MSRIFLINYSFWLDFVICCYDEQQLHYAYKDTIYSSFDSGQNWTAAPTGLPASSSMTDIYFISSLIGYSINYSGYLLKTTDGGLSWNIHHNMSWGAGREVYFINEQVGFLGMSAVVYMTTDGGLTWDSVVGSNSDYINAIHFLTDNVGIAAGGDRIYKTWDGGLTWEESYFPDYGLGILDIYKGYAIQNEGVVLRYQH